MNTTIGRTGSQSAPGPVNVTRVPLTYSHGNEISLNSYPHIQPVERIYLIVKDKLWNKYLILLPGATKSVHRLKRVARGDKEGEETIKR